MLMFSSRFAGLPYLWGGTSTFGYDCSGFTQMLYRQTGVQCREMRSRRRNGPA